MDRKIFAQNFSGRLTLLMRKEGYVTNRNSGRIDINALAEACGCSYQMARKYSLGLGLPELCTIATIAEWLHTSPSHLLFGEDETQVSNRKTVGFIEIETDFLKYILNKGSILFSLTSNTEDVINFIVDTIYDASHINTDKVNQHKIVDMMMASATRWNQDKEVIKNA